MLGKSTDNAPSRPGPGPGRHPPKVWQPFPPSLRTHVTRGDFSVDVGDEAGHSIVDGFVPQIVLEGPQFKPRRQAMGPKILQDVTEELGAAVDEERATLVLAMGKPTR